VGESPAGGGGRGGGGGGVELQLAAPLKYNHASNLPFSVRGTGISFEPATKFPHTSNEPLLPLGTGITLDQPISSDHAINAVVRDAAVTATGYQGTPAPNQWFGGPAIANEGNIVLRDAAGLVVDSLNYGHVVDPWAAEGYQGASPGNGCSVPSLGGGRGGRGGQANAGNKSAGRFPDGADTDSNCNDFHLQTTSALAGESSAGASNIKVTSVGGFTAGQTIFIDSGANRETAVVATVGTAGGTTVGTATAVGTTTIPVSNAFGFSVGQTVTIDSGANQETAVVATVNFGGRGGQGGGARITVTSPLAQAHAEGAQVAGSGVTLTTGLAKAHAGGTSVAANVPTPGASNQYSMK
jgi:non-reducing end alpha-L-arabinofuranosidase